MTNERRNNIIIENVKVADGMIAEEIEEFLKQKLKIDVKIKEAYKIRNDVILVNIEDEKETIEVTQNSHTPKGMEMMDGITMRERNPQGKPKEIAK